MYYSGEFTNIIAYGPQDIDTEFAEKTQMFSTQSNRMWQRSWKPYITLKTLRCAKMGDIITYCDAGCVLNKNGCDTFKKLISYLTTTDIVAFETTYKECRFTKKEVLDFFHIMPSSAEFNTYQLVGGIYIIKKTPGTLHLLTFKTPI